VSCAAQPLSHYEVELRQPDQNERTSTGWRAIKRVGPDGFMSALTFATLAMARTYAGRMNSGQARIVAVERDGWRRLVDEAET
jgi:hypothetical protein